MHPELRRRMCDFLANQLRTNRANVDWMLKYIFAAQGRRDFRTMEEYCAHMRRDKEWAQSMDCLLISKMLNRPVIYVAPSNYQQERRRTVAEVFLPSDKDGVSFDECVVV